MDDDAVPPPIRRSPRAALEHQTTAHDARVDDNDFDEAAPAVPRSRSASLESASSLQNRAPPVNPLAAHPISPGEVTNFSRQKPSRPLTVDPGYLRIIASLHSQPPPPVPHRSPAKLKSYRSNKRLPAHLRRQTSLETIDSVTTTQSCNSDEDEPDPPEAIAPSPYFFTLEDDPATTPVATDAFSLDSSMHSSSVSSRQSHNPPNTPTASIETEPHSPKTIFRKMMRKSNGPAGVPDRLVIERKVSFDRTSHRSSLSASNQSIPSERPIGSGIFDVERSRSGSSSEWSASDFDIAGLTEAEINKCKKKGLNPALYAEMKAARKGKWTSPIAGNTFL
ncbi:hypothetical protein CC86DRAFT_13568 [Ophiobolus disseminans]|uniref:Uncharacterized protein n=1 Tax=Ophiobolus disseminans TaxID=1469910 RepID=A0A6A7AK74_9PLEO|nr:hypothetical protein CC86DRAFT_13568 [Ophiobolus disseminans]